MTVPAPMLSDIKLIASDLDGTLLKGWSPDLSERAREVIRDVVRRGVPFFAASGRQHVSLRRLFGELADDIGYVCENGALGIYRGTVLFQREVPRQKAFDMFRAIQACPFCEPFAAAADTTYILEGYDDFREHLVNVTHAHVTVVKRLEDIQEPIIKVSFKIPPEKAADAVARFNDAFGEGYHVVTSGTIWIDVIQDGTDKGTALQAIGEHLGIDPADMLAFGDELNDREMLDCVGHPYLMETGNSALRSLNDRIRLCSSVEDELERLLASGVERSLE